jgi:hypothetical protein
MGEKRVLCRVLMGIPEGRRPPGKPRTTGEGNIKINLLEVRWGHGMD